MGESNGIPMSFVDKLIDKIIDKLTEFTIEFNSLKNQFSKKEDLKGVEDCVEESVKKIEISINKELKDIKDKSLEPLIKDLQKMMTTIKVVFSIAMVAITLIVGGIQVYDKFIADKPAVYVEKQLEDLNKKLDIHIEEYEKGKQ